MTKTLVAVAVSSILSSLFLSCQGSNQSRRSDGLDGAVEAGTGDTNSGENAPERPDASEPTPEAPDPMDASVEPPSLDASAAEHDASMPGDAGGCGDGIIDPLETCDPPDTCPTECEDPEGACTSTRLEGDPDQCNAECVVEMIASCEPDDGCCPAECDATSDSDCSPSCGDGVMDDGETCDPQTDCPSACNDGDACTLDVLEGSADNCSALCSTVPITACEPGDGCCPEGCDIENDDDCEPACGDGVIEGEETCDPPESCPTACEDGNACTEGILDGSPETCTAECRFVSITACGDGDGCCPAACDSASDGDCSTTCDDGVVDPGETCDPSATCPVSCKDGNACTEDVLTGSAQNCNASCSFSSITDCMDGDGCCPSGCNAASDDDCSATCGNGVLEPGESCDPPETCPTNCNDGNACTNGLLTGSAQNCNAACSFSAVVQCGIDDGCCPQGCNASSDANCSASCDNGVLEPSETCDPPQSCPDSCDDNNACTEDLLTGSAANCSASCSFTIVTSCEDGDGCCPAGCDAVADDDCSASCGNGVVEPGETCDPPESCPETCDDDNECTNDLRTGTAENCNVSCSNPPITECSGRDECCPSGCDANTDPSCSPSCGNGVLEDGETCDPPDTCPTVCDDGDPCTDDGMTGSAINCNVQCTAPPIVVCSPDDECCPETCNANNDPTCEPDCGNGILEDDETCDPPDTCPDCDDGDPCTTDSIASGSADTCDVICSNAEVLTCDDADLCCPDTCNANNDANCDPDCDNGVIEDPETCDPLETCPRSCDDGDPCTIDTLEGDPDACTAECTTSPVTACIDDGCCNETCAAAPDPDCAVDPVCGNGEIDPGETCDPPDTCPQGCSDRDPCTTEVYTGSPDECNAVCEITPITECGVDDGCCPSDCESRSDPDCSQPNVVLTGQTSQSHAFRITFTADGGNVTQINYSADTPCGEILNSTVNFAPPLVVSGGDFEYMPGGTGCPAVFIMGIVDAELQNASGEIQIVHDEAACTCGGFISESWSASR